MIANSGPLNPGEIKVAVLTGGIGRERDVSLQSGRCVADALEKAGLAVVVADVRPDKLDILRDDTIDVFFPALHGQWGEDGRLQQIMQDRSLVYAGSGPAASRLAFDKMASKKAFVEAGVAAPDAIALDPATDLERLEADLADFADKYVIKPITQGSSVGVGIASGPRQAAAAARRALNEFGDCMIERFVPGREVTVGILGAEPLPIIEIRAKSGFYDYHAKYVDEQTEFLFDTIEDAAVVANIHSAALDCFDAIGCRHFARVDFILSDEEIAYALEVNTIPGFTNHSLLPKAAQKAGMSMSDLCLQIAKAALADAGGQSKANPSIDDNKL
jgi:D-alanine-D-alanine ligase